MEQDENNEQGIYFSKTEYTCVLESRTSRASLSRERDIKRCIKNHHWGRSTLKTKKQLVKDGFKLGKELTKDTLKEILQETGDYLIEPCTREEFDFFKKQPFYKKGLQSFVDNNLNPVFDKMDVIETLKANYKDVEGIKFSEIQSFYEEGLYEGYEEVWAKHFPDSVEYSPLTIKTPEMIEIEKESKKESEKRWDDNRKRIHKEVEEEIKAASLKM